MTSNAHRPWRASKPPPKSPPVINPTGHAKVDIVADVVNRTADAWMQVPPAEQGACGVIAAGIGVGLQTFGAPLELLETGFAGLTAELAAMVPGRPAVTISPTSFGLTTPHGHAHPPSFGVPLPGFGPLVFGGSMSVAIGGEPAARAGDMGLAPTCCGFAPGFEVFTGSSNTFIGGSRAARVGDIIRQCDPTLALGVLGKVLGGAGLVAGVAQAGAEANAGKAMAATVAAAQAAADAIALAIAATLGKDPGLPLGLGALTNGNNTVLIGGLPVPDVLDMFGGLLKLAKLGKKALKGKPKVKPKPKVDVEKGKCANPGEPINPATGVVYDEQDDFTDPATGFRWSRWYRSSWADESSPTGLGFRHRFDKQLIFNRTHCLFSDYDGTTIEFPCTDSDAEAYEGTVGGYRLSKLGPRTFLVRHGDDAMQFEAPAERLRWSEARLTEWLCDGLHLQLVYDRHGHLVRIRETKTGQATTHETDLTHDRAGRITTLRRGLVGETKTVIATYSYDTAGCLAIHTDALGGVSRYGYDREQRVIKRTDRNGYSFSWNYDGFGRCIETTGDDGLYQCSLEYEPGRTIVTKGDGGRWTYVYDQWNTIEAIVDPYGGSWRYDFRDDGQIAAQLDPEGRRIEWIYDHSGRLLGRQDAFGHPLPKFDDDPNYQPRRETEPTVTPFGWQAGDTAREHGSTTQLRVPLSMQPTVADVWRGHTPADVTPGPKTHDDAGRLVVEPDASGATERFARDAEGNPIKRIDRDGAAYLQQFTSWNLCTAEEDPEGRVTRFEFDGEQNRTKVTDPGGTVTEFPRDLRGRITRIERAGRVKEHYEYDLADHLTAKRDRHGKTICTYEVGEHGLQVAKRLASGDVIEYAYDRGGRIAEASTTTQGGAVSVVQREHDLAGGVVSDTRDGVGIEHGRTTAGARATLAFGRFETAYRRGDDGEWHVTTPDGSTHTFQHHALGFVLAELSNGARELSCFDAEQRCAGKVAWRSGALEPEPDRTVRYVYSPEGELRSIEDSTRGTTRYAYDRSHRLVHEVSDTGVDEHWEYDAAGNIVTHPELGWGTYAPGNELRKLGGDKATYDDRGNLIELRRGIEWTRYTYDSLDNLVRVQWSDREPTWSAAYDGLGRRTWKQYGDDRTEYYWDDDRLAAEVAPDGALRLYVYTSADALVPFCFVDYDSVDAEPHMGAVFFVFTNQLGAPIRIEDEDGTAVWFAERYSPYGVVELAPGSSVECNLRWPGHYFDAETGLHYNRFRYYSPRQGRYIQTDPLGIGGGINTHAAPANPVATVDVLGLFPCQVKDKPDDGSGSKKTKPDSEADQPARYDRAAIDAHHSAVDAHEAKYREREAAALAEGNTYGARGHRGKVTEAHGERSAALHMEAESSPGGMYERVRMERGFEEGQGYDQVWVRRDPPNDPNGVPEDIIVVEAKGRNEHTGRKAGLGESKDGSQMSKGWVEAKARQMAKSGDPKERQLGKDILRGIEEGPPPKVQGRQITGEDPRPPGPNGRPRQGVEDKPPSTHPSGNYNPDA